MGEHYARLLKSIMVRTDLTHTAKLVHAYLLDAMGKLAYCYPTVNTIAAGIGADPRSVQRAIQELEKADLIHVERDSSRHSNRYELNSPPGVTNCHPLPLAEGDKMSPGRGDNLSPGGDKNAPLFAPSPTTPPQDKTYKPNPPLPPQGGASVGESARAKPLKPPIDRSILGTIYQAYPRHEGRGAAMKALARALLKVSAGELLTAVQDYANSRRVKDRLAAGEQRYIPLMATWLNQERWLDDRNEWTNGKLPQAKTAARVDKEQVERDREAIAYCECWLRSLAPDDAVAVEAEACRRCEAHFPPGTKCRFDMHEPACRAAVARIRFQRERAAKEATC